MPKTIWLGGTVTEYPTWELIGVFSTEKKAVTACEDENDFVAPIPLNAIAPRAHTPMNGYYPLEEREECDELSAKSNS